MARRRRTSGHRWATQVRGPLLSLAVALAYLALTRSVTWLEGPTPADVTSWPAVGVVTAALLLLPVHRWGWILGAVAVTGTAVWSLDGTGTSAPLWWLAADIIGAVTGATLLRRSGRRTVDLVPLATTWSFLVFGVATGPAVGAAIGAIGHVIGGGGSWLPVWGAGTVSSALGVLIVAPALLVWNHPRPSRRRAETVALASALALLAFVVFRDLGPVPVLPYVLAPLTMWAALRFHVRGAAWSMAWVTVIATWASADGTGPFATFSGAAQPSSAVQLYVAVGGASALLLAALVDELSDRAEVERSLTYQAQHDTLTGLPNRAYLGVWLEQILRDDPGDGAIALLVCDLDEFKIINDGLGHQAGDRVLVEVARRLQTLVRPSDVVARLSGDEFAIVVEGADEDALTSLTTRLLSSVPEPVGLPSGLHVTVDLSIGIATATADHDAPSLLRDADAALNRAKERGRARAERFDGDLRVEVMERLTLPQELRSGLVRGELFCVHQPEIDMATGRVFSFESLVRWQHPQRGVLPPTLFVPVAESAGFVGALFTAVLDESLVAQQRWATKLGFRPAISVNLSPRQLHDVSLPAAVASALTRAGVPADLLWLEVTETALADAHSFATLAELHDLGVHLAIDDFGTGWSSMSRLSEFPWDLLKIDRSFVSRLDQDPQAEHVIRAMIVMAHALGIRTVAEGVETTEQFEMLAAMDCDVAQGYLFAKPLAARDAVTDLGHDGRWLGANRAALPGPVGW